MAEKPNTVQVEIFGQTYSVKAGAEPGHVEQLAAHVDKEMRDIGRSSGAVDSVRIAVLAALNIADELFRLRARAQEGETRLERRAAELAKHLGSALDEP